MLESARKKLSDNTETVTTLENFKQAFKRTDKLNTFVIAPFIDDEKVKRTITDLGVTVRCIPLAQPKIATACLFTGQATQSWALYAKSY
jgi:prolyl-tRNA synthetase